jgi:hypothetical protein
MAIARMQFGNLAIWQLGSGDWGLEIGDSPPPLEGGGRGEGYVCRESTGASTPPPNPLPQGEGEKSSSSLLPVSFQPAVRRISPALDPCVCWRPPMTLHRIPASGLFLALLALVAQLAFGAVVPRPDVALVLDQAGPICHAAAPADGTTPPAPHRHMPDCQFCPLCMALATPGIVLPGAGPHLPPPQVAAFRRPGLPPPATAPPVVALLAAQPRGPPVLA